MDEPQVFLLTLLALYMQTDGGETTGAASATSVITVQSSVEDAEQEARELVMTKYPPTEGWFNHQVHMFELPEAIETNGYRLEFAVSELDA